MMPPDGLHCNTNLPDNLNNQRPRCTTFPRGMCKTTLVSGGPEVATFRLVGRLESLVMAANETARRANKRGDYSARFKGPFRAY